MPATARQRQLPRPTRRRGWCQYRRLSAKWAPRAPGDIGWTCGWRDRLLDGAAASAEQSESDDSDDEREDARAGEGTTVI